METNKFDYENFKKEAAQRLKNGESLLGKEGVFTNLLKDFLEATHERELESHIATDKNANRKNGKGK